MSTATRTALRSSDVARLLRCSQAQAIKFMDSGEMKTWRVPMSKHRRTTMEAVIAFAKKRGIEIQTETG